MYEYLVSITEGILVIEKKWKLGEGFNHDQWFFDNQDNSQLPPPYVSGVLKKSYYFGFWVRDTNEKIDYQQGLTFCFSEYSKQILAEINLLNECLRKAEKNEDYNFTNA